MAVTADTVRETFPEFDGCSDTAVERWLAHAARRVNETQWAGMYDDGVLWLTAHLLKVNANLSVGLQAGTGAVKSQRVGDLSVTFEVPQRMSQSFLASTTYGQYFLDMQANVFPTRVLGSCSTGCA